MSIRAAVVGYGTGGRVFHAPFLAADPAFTVVAVVTGDPGRAAAALVDHPGAQVVPDLDSLLERSGELGLDLVIVSTPPARHAEQAAAALEAGLHVVVDKPVTVTGEQGRALLAAAERAGRMLTAYQNRRWDGDFRTLRRLAGAGELGTVLRLESRFERWKPAESKAWKAGRASTGAGLLYDLGAHLLDQAVLLLGPVQEVYAELLHRRPGEGADDDTFVALQHAGGAVSHLWMSSVAPRPGPRFRVVGSQGVLTCHGLDPTEQQLTAGVRATDPGLGAREEDVDALLATLQEQRRVPLDRGDYGAFYRGVARTLTEGAPPPVDPRQSVAVVELIERIHREFPVHRPGR